MSFFACFSVCHVTTDLTNVIGHTFNETDEYFHSTLGVHSNWFRLVLRRRNNCKMKTSWAVTLLGLLEFINNLGSLNKNLTYFHSSLPALVFRWKFPPIVMSSVGYRSFVRRCPSQSEWFSSWLALRFAWAYQLVGFLLVNTGLCRIGFLRYAGDYYKVTADDSGAKCGQTTNRWNVICCNCCFSVVDISPSFSNGM